MKAILLPLTSCCLLLFPREETQSGLQGKWKVQFTEHRIWGIFKGVLCYSHPTSGKRLQLIFSMEQKGDSVHLRLKHLSLGFQVPGFVLVIRISRELGMGDVQNKNPNPNKATTNEEHSP